MAQSSSPAPPADCAGNLTDYLAEALKGYSTVRNSMLQFLQSSETRAMQGDGVDAVIARRAAGVGTGSAAVEKELEAELGALTRHQEEFDALLTSMAEQQQTSKVGSLGYTSELEALDQRACALRRVHDPRVGRDVEIVALHYDAILDEIQRHIDPEAREATALVDMLCAAVRNLDQAQRVGDQRTAVAELQYQRQIECLTDELFILKRQLMAKTEIINYMKDMGFEVGSRFDIEERSVEALDDFTRLTGRLRQLEQELSTKDEIERRLTDNLEVLKKDKQSRALVQIATNRRLDEVSESLSHTAQKMQDAASERDNLRSMLDEAHAALCQCFPSASHFQTMSVPGIVAAHVEALGSLRGLVQEMCGGQELRDDARSRYAQGHALQTEVVQLIQWARGMWGKLSSIQRETAAKAKGALTTGPIRQRAPSIRRSFFQGAATALQAQAPSAERRVSKAPERRPEILLPGSPPVRRSSRAPPKPGDGGLVFEIPGDDGSAML
eukprot:TRINITY_DN47736_c0_g1_i1.p1 TRINITY_DN47736_c0_g1~~TRINITY_DN47736_c0_g1_i1.p1  ORF type:complete len:499 (+),score=170.31 TRINITY_DN47736_c0_g1_i1:67-1563(+)